MSLISLECTSDIVNLPVEMMWSKALKCSMDQVTLLIPQQKIKLVIICITEIDTQFVPNSCLICLYS